MRSAIWSGMLGLAVTGLALASPTPAQADDSARGTTQLVRGYRGGRGYGSRAYYPRRGGYGAYYGGWGYPYGGYGGYGGYRSYYPRYYGGGYYYPRGYRYGYGYGYGRPFGNYYSNPGFFW